jgi:predicted aconitase with swiveling domain|tara:strand:- start:70 stop:207 length:138 start_codon:yes stop_codon:yes gene_type:complete
MAEGNALVLNEGFSYLEGVNMETGEFNEESYHGLGKIKILQGKSH